MKLLSLGLSLIGLLVLAPAALAQSAGPEGLSGDSSSTEVFSGSGVDFFDLVHQAGRLSSNPVDFSRQQQRRIPNAVEDFRQRQQEALLQQEAESTLEADETLVIE